MIKRKSIGILAVSAISIQNHARISTIIQLFIKIKTV